MLEFPDGFLMSFTNPVRAPGQVKVDAEKWASGLGAFYVTLTARWDKYSGQCVVDEPESFARA